MQDILDFCKNREQADRVIAHRKRIAHLLDKGVNIPSPHAIEVGEDVNLTQISENCTLHSGTKLLGVRTVVCPGAVIGKEAPVCLDNTVVGHNVVLNGGMFQQATLLDNASTGNGAHLRQGTLLEEGARVAHCVGLKQSILFPFVTLGSLINFCDVLMAGGTGPKDHSEVGSGYIHFNFTPRADKATPSLFGDVPRGVLLRSPRIFLGGLAASVGPMKVGYGSFLGPGEVFRRDVKEDRFTLGERKRQLGNIDFDPEVFTGVRGKLVKNMRFVGQLIALWHWYQSVRIPSAQTPWQTLCYQGGLEAVEMALTERLSQLTKLMGRLPRSIEKLEKQGAQKRAETQRALVDKWPEAHQALSKYGFFEGLPQQRQTLLTAWNNNCHASSYVERVKSLNPAEQEAARLWLDSISDHVVETVTEII